MMKFFTLPVGLIRANCYIISADGRGDCVLVDPGAEADKIEKKLTDLKLVPSAILLTHAHFDHSGAVRHFQDKGVKVYMHEADEAVFASSEQMASRLGGIYERFEPDIFITDGQDINLCGLTFKVIHTPGHSAGSVCYMCENAVFSGDTLFYMSIGRTDFPTGNMSDMEKSLEKLFALCGNYTVYPGHGNPTSLDFERKNNPYA